MFAPMQVSTVDMTKEPVELAIASTLSAIAFNWLVRSITPPNIIATMTRLMVYIIEFIPPREISESTSAFPVAAS